jgi:hypothetical protein
MVAVLLGRDADSVCTSINFFVQNLIEMIWVRQLKIILAENEKESRCRNREPILTSRCREVFCSDFLNVIRQGTLILAGEKKKKHKLARTVSP